MPRTKRRFTLADLLILVAAAAISFGFTRLKESFMVDDWIGMRQAHPSFVVVGFKIHFFVQYALIGLSSAQLALRVLPPRPPLRRVMRQPGALVGLAVPTTLIVGAIFNIRRVGGDDGWWYWKFPRLEVLLNRLTDNNVQSFVCAIAACWIGVLVSGRWSRPRDWVERMGRVLGWVWFLNGILFIVVRGVF